MFRTNVSNIVKKQDLRTLNKLFSLLKQCRWALSKVVPCMTIILGQEERKKYPNQGMYNSLRHAFIAGGIVFFILIFIRELPGFAKDPVLHYVVAGFPMAFMAGFYFGGAAYIKHIVLRLILSLKGDIPWNLAHFLDYAAERALLRKIGGGYIFIHWTLLEYFSLLYEERSMN